MGDKNRKPAERAREKYLQHHPRICQICDRTHGNGVAIELHHIDENIHNNDFSNFQWLCQEHHMMKHGRIAWSALNVDGLEQSQSSEETKRILMENNPHSREEIDQHSAKYIRKGIFKRLGWNRADAARQGNDTPRTAYVHDRHGFVTIEIRGTRIQIPVGESVKFF